MIARLTSRNPLPSDCYGFLVRNVAAAAPRCRAAIALTIAIIADVSSKEIGDRHIKKIAEVEQIACRYRFSAELEGRIAFEANAEVRCDFLWLL